ncbi:hypothetical protein TNCT_519091 [Trichonephila clavata]|uniref:Uncharacterized protein n=1 Tax=Trichonephila clavata TaxID=2740835 RepID=A0A8X6M0A9_TRICU|nr:hypothetical protein TNCT_519091 [Trichonephila clavata]
MRLHTFRPKLCLGSYNIICISFLFGAFFQWTVPSEYYWYQSNRSGGFLTLDCSRQNQNTLTRFLFEYLTSLTYTDGSMQFAPSVSLGLFLGTFSRVWSTLDST